MCYKKLQVKENIQQKSSNEKNIAEESLEGAEKTVQENIKEESSKSPKKKVFHAMKQLKLPTQEMKSMC